MRSDRIGAKNTTFRIGCNNNSIEENVTIINRQIVSLFVLSFKDGIKQGLDFFLIPFPICYFLEKIIFSWKPTLYSNNQYKIGAGLTRIQKSGKSPLSFTVIQM